MSARGRALLVVIGLALAGLPSQASADQSVTMKEFEFQLDPNHLDATTGQVVHFTVTNTGTVQHNLEVEINAPTKVEKKLFDTNLQPGETRTVDFTFTQTGKWDMYCPVDSHRNLGMRGDINVAAAAGLAPAAPAAAPAPVTAPAPAAAPVAAPPAQPAPPAARPGPAQLPRTGEPVVPLAIALAGLALLGSGLAARQRRS